MPMTTGEWQACNQQAADLVARLRQSQAKHPGRELALAITKVQEAQHWLQDDVLVQGLVE